MTFLTKLVISFYVLTALISISFLLSRSALLCLFLFVSRRSSLSLSSSLASAFSALHALFLRLTAAASNRRGHIRHVRELS